MKITALAGVRHHTQYAFTFIRRLLLYLEQQKRASWVSIPAFKQTAQARLGP
jgi:hypothetical protein